MDSVQIVKYSCQDRPMHADFMKGQVVHFDGIDPVTNIILHPLSHFAISNVRQIFNGTTELGGVGEIIKCMMEQ